MVLSLLTSQKRFSDPWVGSEKLNHLGLHKARMRVAALCANTRRSIVSLRTGQWKQDFARDGFIKVENFLPSDEYSRLLKEVSGVATQTKTTSPYPVSKSRGFGKPINHSWGIDRFDGGTLNRFIDIDKQAMPQSSAFTRNKKLQSLCRAVVGLPLRASNIRIYELVNNDDAANHDIQKDFHRDTFFSSMKFWYFLSPVTADDGPFMFVPGSHKLSPARLEWEHHQALKALEGPGICRGGSFRVSLDELKAFGLPDPLTFTVPANTLIMADTLGFHRRGDAKANSNRLSIYSSNRPYPFFPIGL